MAKSTEPASRTPLPIVRLGAVERREDSRVARIEMKIAGEPVHLEITVPTGPVPADRLLPVFQGLTDLVVAVGVQHAERAGKTVSCQAGCGACCRQLVPIAAPEVRMLTALVRAMPDVRRAQVMERFRQACATLQAAGLLETLRYPGTKSGQELRPLGEAYFRLAIPCPFLEEESCSIHADRPLACREYLVTSPAQNCKNPGPETIEMVSIPGYVAARVRRLENSASAADWVPLILALDLNQACAATPPVRPGPDWLVDLLKNLARNPFEAEKKAEPN